MNADIRGKRGRGELCVYSSAFGADRSLAGGHPETPAAGDILRAFWDNH
jgi:hypothetical protein